MEGTMRQSTIKRNETKRLDALLALPLDRFRRALSHLTADELTALNARLLAQQVRNRWARGGFGVARHRSPQELALLARRETALRQERARRLEAAPAVAPLVFPQPQPAGAASELGEKQAA
jgi:hypothetical protein